MAQNRIKHALSEGVNLVTIATALGISAVTVSFVPALIGLVAEAAYLLFVPDSKWYQARLAQKFDAEIELKRQEMKDKILPTLRPDIQQRFARLEAMRLQIATNAKDDESWFREVLRKLDYLLEKYLLFATKEAQFRTYLQSVLDETNTGNPTVRADWKPFDYAMPEQSSGKSKAQGRARRVNLDAEDAEWNVRSAARSAAANYSNESSEKWTARVVEEVSNRYDRDLKTIAEETEAETDADTRGVLLKRTDVVQRRKEFIGKIGRILTNVSHQMQLLEDTFGLINDEVRARSPEQVLADIDDVVYQTDTMTQTLEELASFDQSSARLTLN